MALVGFHVEARRVDVSVNVVRHIQSEAGTVTLVTAIGRVAGGWHQAKDSALHYWIDAGDTEAGSEGGNQVDCAGGSRSVCVSENSRSRLRQ